MKIVLDVVPNHASPAYSFKEAQEIPQFGEIWEDGKKIHDYANDSEEWFHHNGTITDYEDPDQLIYNDLEYLADFNHENPAVRAWLYAAYGDWVSQGLDGIRIDALKHMPRDLFLIPFANEMLERRYDLFMFGESFEGDPSKLSPFTYNDMDQSSHISVLDFPNFFKSQGVFVYGAAYSEMNWLLDQDENYFDASFLVTFVDNHDVSRFAGDANQLRDNLNWIYAIRGIPAVYYGTEVEFQAAYAAKPGRAYFGAAEMKKAPDHEIYQHIQKLNRLRHDLVALQKGDMQRITVDQPAKSFAFSRTFKQETVYVALNKSNDWVDITFKEIPNGTYTDQMSNWSIVVTDAKLTFGVSPHSMAVYVKP
jgi:cyclomaltodextrin glucanotransferase